MKNSNSRTNIEREFLKTDVLKGLKMTDAVGLREIVPNSCLPERCREFIIHTGKLGRVDDDVEILASEK